MVRIYTPNGYAILGYYRLKSEAVTALVEAAGRPPASRSSPTVDLRQLFEEWMSRKANMSQANIYTYQNAFNQLEPIWKKPVRFISVTDIEEAVRTKDPAPTVRVRIKSLLSQLYRYAIAHDLADKNPAEFIDIKKELQPEQKVTRRTFDPWEVSELFKSRDPYFQIALVGVYTGMRPNELLKLCPAEVDLEAQMFHIHGSKTKSGHFRHIPIHPSILPLIEEKLAESAKFGSAGLFYNRLGHRLYYEAYHARMKELNHTPHDTRHTFATYAKISVLDALAVKRILGHSSKDLTEEVYTHTGEAFLKREMSKYFIV